MQKRLADTFASLDAARARLLETVAGVNPSFGEMQPRSGSWSVAQVVSHLGIVETNVAGLISRSVIWAKEHGIGPETSEESVANSLDQFAIVEGGKKIEAPESILPPQDARMDDSLRAVTDSRRALKEALAGGDGMDLSAVKRPHRIFGELSLYQWGLFIAQHEQRHIKQIERTIRELTEGAAESAPIF